MPRAPAGVAPVGAGGGGGGGDVTWGDSWWAKFALDRHRDMTCVMCEVAGAGPRQVVQGTLLRVPSDLSTQTIVRWPNLVG